MNIRDIMKEALETAQKKGFRNLPRSLAEDIALMHSELSEALEAYRDPKYFMTEMYHTGSYKPKPEGVAVEFADVIIRICESCEHNGIPLEWAIKTKLKYNKTRPYRHGGKRI